VASFAEGDSIFAGGTRNERNGGRSGAKIWEVMEVYGESTTRTAFQWEKEAATISETLEGWEKCTKGELTITKNDYGKPKTGGGVLLWFRILVVG